MLDYGSSIDVLVWEKDEVRRARVKLQGEICCRCQDFRGGKVMNLNTLDPPKVTFTVYWRKKSVGLLNAVEHLRDTHHVKLAVQTDCRAI